MLRRILRLAATAPLIAAALVHAAGPSAGTPETTRLTRAATSALTLPAGTPLTLRLTSHAAMKVGQRLQAELLYPVYADGVMVLPRGTLCLGKVVALASDAARRRRAVFSMDFTPFHRASVQFDQIVLPQGGTLRFASLPSDQAAMVYRLIAPVKKGSFMAESKKTMKKAARSEFSPVIGPNKGDKLLQYLYTQLPYHPERLENTYVWTVDLAQPLTLPAPLQVVRERPVTALPLPSSPQPKPEHWMIEAALVESLDSSTAKPGQTVHARVLVPVRNDDDSIAIPVGATLTGKVTLAEDAALFGRSGQLRMTFDRVEVPSQLSDVSEAGTADETAKIVEASTAALLSPAPVSTESLTLTPVSTRAFEDNRRHEFAGPRGGSDGIGFVNHFANAFAATHLMAMSLGNYGTALMVFDKVVAPGRSVRLNHDTRIFLETNALPPRLTRRVPLYNASNLPVDGLNLPAERLFAGELNAAQNDSAVLSSADDASAMASLVQPSNQ